MNSTNLSPILDALQLAELPAEEQEALLLELNELVFKGTLVRFVELMDESSRAEFTKLLESDADEAIVETFLRERVPNVNRVVEETVAELADDILAVTGTNKE